MPGWAAEDGGGRCDAGANAARFPILDGGVYAGAATRVAADPAAMRSPSRERVVADVCRWG